METINKFIAQLRDLFHSMTPGARVTAGLLLATVVSSVGYLFVSGSTHENDYLFGGEQLSSGELRAIEQALLAQGIDVDISRNRVRVPTHQKYEAMAAIATADAMPPNLHAIMTKALESASFWEGGAKTKERVEAAKEQYLAMVIRSMPWVHDANVNYDEKKPNGLRREDIVTAAVTITPVPGESVDPRRDKALKTLASRWFAGMKPEDVAVIDLHNMGGASGGRDSLELLALTESAYMKEQILYQQYKRDEILRFLNIPGVRVEVRAELEPNLISETFTQTPGEKGTSLRTQSETETTTQTTTEVAGRPGVVAQGPGGPQPTQATPTTQNESERTSDKFDNIVGITEQRIEKAGLTPVDVHASIQIPMDYIVEIWKTRWRRENPTAKEADMPAPTADELQRLTEQKKTDFETSVENLLPDANPGEDPFPRVQITFYERPAIEAIAEPTFAQTAMAWTASHWSMIAMFCLALVSLFMLRSMVKSIASKRDQSPLESPTLQLESPDETDEEGENEDESRPKLKLNKGPSLKDDLAQLVREDPDTAASILKSWIARAA